jgi:hypothetical protein
MSERWGIFPELEASASRLENLPLDIADWKGQEGEKMDARMKKAAGSVGDLHRVYTSSTQKEPVTLDIVCGRPRDMFSHTPERCYPAAGFERGGTQDKTTIDGVEGEFFTNTYIKSDPSGTTNLRIYWAWTPDGAWEAPDDFKWKLGAQRALFKLYVMVPVTNREQGTDRNAAAEFIRVLIPELRKTLFQDQGAAKANDAATEKKS